MKKNPVVSLVKRVYRLGPNRPVLARRKGHRFLLSTRNWIDNRMLAGAYYEDRQLARARALIEQRDIDTIVDIGANIGLYTISLGALPGIKDVIAFEPVRRNFAQLMGNVFVNDLADRVTAHRLALGSSPGETRIFINPTSTGVSRLDLEHTKAPAEFTHEELITIETLDRVCTLSDRKVFIKIDVEGHAPAVIAGARTFLANNNVVLQMEISGSEVDVVAELAKLGLKRFDQIDDDCYFARTP